MVIEYNKGINEYSNWVVEETEFKEEYQSKLETIFSLGNGYMGLRASMEEKYPGEQRGFYISGIFDKYPGEVTEMPNLPDWINTNIYINNKEFNLNNGKIYEYTRKLNLKEGLLTRQFIWENNEGERVKFRFERFISLDNLHIGISNIEIQALNFSGEIKIISGWDGRICNSGTQHLIEGAKRLIDDHIIYEPETQESNIKLCFGLGHNISFQEENHDIERSFKADRRRIKRIYKFNLNKNKKVSIMKLATAFTEKDKDINLSDGLENITLKTLKNYINKGYQSVKNAHIERWKSVWNEIDVKIIGSDFDQLAIRFALFHLIQMTPAHDERISIAAKGLSGEGYKGHVFWDTEVFLLPFFIYNYPEIAKSLLKYRYNTLEGARGKANNNGYRGAMFAWESADTGEETTPKNGAVDILTGKEIRIWCGEIEQHITVDIQYAFDQFFQATRDFEFMKRYGFEVFFECARFWSSRLEYNENKDQYEINNVMGPDEYKEHIDNNAFINHLVYWQFNKLLEYIKELRMDHTKYYKKLKDRIKLTDQEIESWKKKKEKIYLPQPDQNNIIPQFQGYKKLDELDLDKYKNGSVGKIFNDLGWENITKSKVSKQADVVMLIYLLEEKFDSQTIKSNYDYYEPFTLHDSSLSPAIHAAVASRLGEVDNAYKLFERATRIDLGKNKNSSDQGLHAASLGGLWQSIIFGFAGIRFKNDVIKVKPHLPDKWSMVSFKINYRNNKYTIIIDKEKIKIEVLKVINDLEFEINNKRYQITKNTKIKY